MTGDNCTYNNCALESGHSGPHKVGVPEGAFIPALPDPEMIREIKELNRRFREGLKNWQPRLP